MNALRTQSPTVPSLSPLPDRVLLLSVDFEDWHQLIRRRVGAASWREPGPALARQTDALLSLFDELHVRCTFFILGMAARAHPELVYAIAQRGHELACHGDQHLPVHAQTPAEFAADLRAARATIEDLTGSRPAGYRAPAFSVPAQGDWWQRVLIDEGFVYDASRCASPTLGRAAPPALGSPHALPGGELWEFPVAVSRIGPGRIPVGGASYWSLAPAALITRWLEATPSGAGLYLHPHELDPEPLDPLLAPGTGRAQRARAQLWTARRNLARRRATPLLRAIAKSHPLIPYGEAHAQLRAGSAARP
jgi:polysaccharide deacetylase family protein (PEP-CTERM system associated)